MFITVLIILYFLPAIISLFKYGFSTNTFIILLYNLIFGWTVIAWIVLILNLIANNYKK